VCARARVCMNLYITIYTKKCSELRSVGVVNYKLNYKLTMTMAIDIV